MHNSYDRLAQLLCEVPEYAVEGRLNKNIVAELARKYDAGLINKLLSEKDMRKLFFSESDAGLIFKKDIFLQFISQKEFLPDSYTAFEQKIGLASGGTMLRNDDRVVLNWPYKDCILEGGQTKEDAKRDEVFFNEILAPDEINTILEDKVFTNWKRYDKDGEHELDELKPEDNLIIKGNNLVVLHSLKKRFADKINLIYIDPPYNTGSDSFGYNDCFNHSSWLTFMKNRLEVAKKLLSSDGSIFIQCDENEQAYLKVLCDEIFGIGNFVNCICVKMSEATGVKMTHVDKKLPKIKEYILVYKKQNLSLHPEKVRIPAGEMGVNYKSVVVGADEEQLKRIRELMNQESVSDEDVGEFDELVKGLSLHTFSEINPNWSSLSEDEKNKWKEENAYRIVREVASASAKKIADKKRKTTNNDFFGIKTTNNKLYFIKNHYNESAPDPNIKLIFAIDYLFIKPCDLWTDIKTTRVDREGSVALKNGKKPEKLLRRIIELSTEPGDIVLDYHVGSGTTAAVAHKMGRQYIGVEQLNYGENDSIKRLQNVISGDQTGISDDEKWVGGGSFVYCNIKNDANKFREKVQAADDKNMDDLLDEALHSSFLSYRIDAKNNNIKLGDFHKLSLVDKKHILLDLIDNNTLYLNYSEIDDATYKISDEDKKHNKAFYGE